VTLGYKDHGGYYVQDCYTLLVKNRFMIGFLEV